MAKGDVVVASGHAVVEGLVAIGVNLWPNRLGSAAEGVMTVALVIQQLVTWALVGCLLRAIFLELRRYAGRWRMCRAAAA